MVLSKVGVLAAVIASIASRCAAMVAVNAGGNCSGLTLPNGGRPSASSHDSASRGLCSVVACVVAVVIPASLKRSGDNSDFANVLPPLPSEEEDRVRWWRLRPAQALEEHVHRGGELRIGAIGVVDVERHPDVRLHRVARATL